MKVSEKLTALKKSHGQIKHYMRENADICQAHPENLWLVGLHILRDGKAIGRNHLRYDYRNALDLMLTHYWRDRGYPEEFFIDKDINRAIELIKHCQGEGMLKRDMLIKLMSHDLPKCIYEWLLMHGYIQLYKINYQHRQAIKRKHEHTCVKLWVKRDKEEQLRAFAKLLNNE